MEPITISLIVLAGLLAALAVFALGAHFAPTRSAAAAKVEAVEVKSFQAIISESMLAWQAEQSKQATAIAVQTAALASDKAAFAATQQAVAAMAAGVASAAAQP